jgi:hypothetical protein
MGADGDGSIRCRPAWPGLDAAGSIVESGSSEARAQPTGFRTSPPMRSGALGNREKGRGLSECGLQQSLQVSPVWTFAQSAHPKRDGGLGCWWTLRGDNPGSQARAATWLILPVVICLSQRLSHACLSISCLYCETANGSLNQL